MDEYSSLKPKKQSSNTPPPLLFVHIFAGNFFAGISPRDVDFDQVIHILHRVSQDVVKNYIVAAADVIFLAGNPANCAFLMLAAQSIRGSIA